MLGRTYAQPPREEREEARRLRMAREAATVKPRAITANYSRLDKTLPKPRPKPETPRNAAVLDMAQDRRCLLLAVEGCRGADGMTTVAAHRNEGKGMGLKQSDAYTCWACGPCHEWYDRSGSPREEKRRAFMEAHLRQVLRWREVAADPSEPERFRRAARWALEQLNSTLIEGLDAAARAAL